jgi:Flp pilus assembly protein CpaB
VPLEPALRALAAPRRVDLRVLFGGFLTVVATAGSIAFWSTSSDSRGVVVAARDVPAGTVLGSDHLGVSYVRVDDATYRAAVPAADRAGLLGRVLEGPLYAHQVLVRAQLTGQPPLGPDEVALTIPISAEAAVGGRLHPGAAVQVLATTEKGKPESRTFVVLPRATVYDIGREERPAGVAGTSAGRGADGLGRPVSVSLRVSHEQARDLAWVRWNADLDLALLPAQPSGR